MPTRRSSSRPWSNEEVRRLVAAIGFPTIALDARNLIVGWNRVATELLGFAQKAVVGKGFDEVIEASDVFGNRYCSRNTPLHGMSRAGETIHPFSVEILDADSNPVPVVVSVDVLPAGHPASYFLVLRLRPERRRGADLLATALLKLPFLADLPTDGDGREGRSNDQERLTVRQREILRLLAEGRSAQEVADHLSISVHTVHNHCRNILERLHAHNKVEAVATALRRRWI